MNKRIKPYRNRKPYKRKQGGGKFMLPGGRYGKSPFPGPGLIQPFAPGLESIQFFAKFLQMFSGFKRSHSKKND